MSADNQGSREDLLAAILSEESYRPSEPTSLDDIGVPVSMIESLILKLMLTAGNLTGRKIADGICLPFLLLEDVYQALRSRQVITHIGSAPFNDYTYALTDVGRERARSAMASCSYCGPAPVPLSDYVLSTEAQTIRAESPRRKQLLEAFQEISIDPELFESLGPAINSGAGLFLYGEPGNGKSTLAKRITQCFGQRIWIPRTLVEDSQIIKLYDPAYHQADDGQEQQTILKTAAYDRRWIKIRRPTVVVGGELTLDSLEIAHNVQGNVSEAPIQMKSNCGCLLIDDFGRQRVDPASLLNRWIVPLEARIDFLTLPTGKKIQVPFEQLIIFSTNLEPSDLVDDAFLRRIPYKIEITDPSYDEVHQLFKIYAKQFRCDYDADAVEYLLETHYRQTQRAIRRCHPRDLLSQIRDYCAYNELPTEMRPEYFDRAVRGYFTMISCKQGKSISARPAPAPPAPAAAPFVPGPISDSLVEYANDPRR
ncbi:MAG: AAA family ATPase [Planctomycetales bacterium]|nr:AAA family ATPase [Planctomycetales bacterium]